LEAFSTSRFFTCAFSEPQVIVLLVSFFETGIVREAGAVEEEEEFGIGCRWKRCSDTI
jgi:hypothetical protein